MVYGIFKGLYKGRGIYYYPGRGYGDESTPNFRKLSEMKAAIDSFIAAENAKPIPPHEAYWLTLSSQERDKWRQKCSASDLSASELAYSMRSAS